MAFINDYPYTDFHEMNLDWVIAEIKKLNSDMSTFEAVNKIKYMGLWDASISYAPWSVVERSNIGYISIQAVPIGISLDNQSYWRVIGDYTASYNELRALIDALSARVDKIENHKYVFLGDSYNYYGGGWYTRVCTALGLTDSVNAYDYTVSGHGFISIGESYKWLTDITRFVSEHPTVTNSITDIVIVGGINDATATAANLGSAIDEFFAYVKTNLPNALVRMVYVGCAKRTSSVLEGRTAQARMNSIRVETQHFAKNGGVMVVGSENALCQYTLFGDDGLHPNTYGQQNIFSAVVEGIKNGSVDFPVYTTVSDSYGAYNEIISNGRVTLSLVDVLINNSVTLTYNYVTLKELPANISVSYMPPITIELDNRLPAASTKIPVKLMIEDHKIKAAVAYTTNLTSYPTYTTSTNVVIPAAVFENVVQNAM